MSPSAVANRPVLATCPAPEAGSLLSGAERTILSSFSCEKRRRDWLCGRLAAKAAAGRWLDERGISWPAASIEILNAESGQPYVSLPQPPEEPVFLSLSHCEAGGLAAAHRKPVGVDWEPVAPRDPGVLAFFIHPSEAPEAGSPERQTALWTVKEAVLKLLGVGLAGGPQQVRWAGGRLELDGAARQRWRELGSPELAVEQEFQRHLAGTISSAVAFCL